MFAVGDILCAIDQHCWGDCSTLIHFGKVVKVTKTGRYNVNIVENILNDTHPESKKTDYGYYYRRVVTPGTKVVDYCVLNNDGVARGDTFGCKSYVKFEKYDENEIMIENIDMNN